MDKLRQDLRRLEIIQQSSVGLEQLQITLRLSDFVKYYFTKFVTNLTGVFKEFTKSEIEIYNTRHGLVLSRVLKDPLLDFSSVLVPIPKGMVGSYRQTTDALETLLKNIDADDLLHDLSKLIGALERFQLGEYNLDIPYTKDKFNSDITWIGHLFSKVGLIHSTGKVALECKEYVSQTKTTLTDITSKYYPMAINLIPKLNELETIHTKIEINESTKEYLSICLMELAYRLSIFGIVLEHIQDIEHNFVQCLDIVRKHSLRNM